MTKKIAMLLAGVMTLSLVACGSSTGTAESTEDNSKVSNSVENTEVKTEETSNSESKEASAEPTTITVWTCNSGDTNAWLAEAAQRFNESQSDYVVEHTYGGSYEEVLAKLSATKAGSYPDIFHSDTESAYTYYANPDVYVPIEKYVQADGYDMSNIMGNLQATYTMDGEWQCMPLGNTVAGYFYNADLLEQAGIDPNTDLNSYEEMLVACQKLKDIGVSTPLHFGSSSSFYSMALTAQGIDYVDNNNGKDGIPTKSLVGEEGACHDATVSYFQIVKDLKAAGLMVPYGTASADVNDMFANGECAIVFGFISSFKTMSNVVGDAFEMGFHSIPTINAGTENVGQCTGGGCLFLSNNGDENRERGAWEFMKFLMADENAVGYSMVSGYLPISTTAVETAEYQKYLDTVFPTARQSLEAQENTPEDVYNAWLPMFADFHAMIKEYTAKAYDDDSKTAEEWTNEFAKAFDETIELYNLSH